MEDGGGKQGGGLEPLVKTRLPLRGRRQGCVPREKGIREGGRTPGGQKMFRIGTAESDRERELE